ncbi:MAG: hypothetical protein QOD74_515 [Variibacter sp.]|nr:hypothetical protein [Variibacter sp.]
MLGRPGAARRATLCVVLAALSSAGIVVTTGNGLAREFRAADTQAENYPTVQALAHMGRLVAEKTSGRHRITVFHSRQLGEEKETIEQTRVGAIDINRTNVAPLGSFVPLINVLTMPFLFRSSEHLHTVLDGPIGEELLGRLEPFGFIGLAYYDSGARSIYNALRPIRNPNDLKGLRLRVQQSELMVAMLRALGAEPVELPYGQVLTGLATKLIDGAENNWPSYISTEHYKSAPHYSLTEHTMGPEIVVMSSRAWQTLSKEDQQALREAARASSLFMREQWRAWEDEARRKAAEAGVAIVAEVDKAAFEQAVAGLYREISRDPEIKGMIQRIRDAK